MASRMVSTGSPGSTALAHWINPPLTILDMGAPWIRGLRYLCIAAPGRRVNNGGKPERHWPFHEIAQILKVKNLATDYTDGAASNRKRPAASIPRFESILGEVACETLALPGKSRSKTVPRILAD